MVRPETSDAQNNQQLVDLYSGLAEVVSEMPDGLPKLLDEIFADTIHRRGHVGHSSSGDGTGTGPALTLLNSSIGDRLVLELPKYIDLDDIRPSFWEHFDAETDRGHGTLFVSWHARGFSQRISNVIEFGSLDINTDGINGFKDITPYQELILLYAEVVDTEEKKKSN
ncbi:MAG TPA: hypothetical protein VIH90_00555 [Candidatus Saccharimonadales bacterium]